VDRYCVQVLAALAALAPPPTPDGKPGWLGLYRKQIDWSEPPPPPLVSPAAAATQLSFWICSARACTVILSSQDT
jgi:hypothetical protein